jgi:putative hemolysin
MLVDATAAAFSGASLAARLTPPLQGCRARTRRRRARAPRDRDRVRLVPLVGFSSSSRSPSATSEQELALLVARPLHALAWFAPPLIWILTKSSNAVLRPFGGGLDVIHGSAGFAR